MDVILSIKPKYVDAILRGEKKYEFRKNIFKGKKIDDIYIYSSSPIKKIVASFTVKRIIEDRPNNLWDKLKDYSGLDDKEFFNYFTDNGKGFAIEIDNLEKFKNPIDPKTLIPGFTPPQSFCYLEASLLPKNNINKSKVSQKNNFQPTNNHTKQSYQETLFKYNKIALTK
ncbi:MAG: 50S ribosomal protein L22/unknown domain fusion protein [Methanosaeta sp. PtaU1.Bin060]|jgi:type I restriction enzyme S subunit|nr:MAG: 50S ribosomal protein L22/unknown domain fusion protein [Methanosaeta sp. PtaU1.Bin060]